jgi:hypothetical protein
MSSCHIFTVPKDYMLQKLSYLCITLTLIVALNFSLERTALAYVDPGSGLLAFQSFSAVVTGALFYFRTRIRNLFLKTRQSDPSRKNN